MSLIRMTYFSTVNSKTEALQGISFMPHLLRHARRFNLEHAITGALVLANGYFVQTIEGRRLEVTDLFRKICSDDRHSRIELVDARAARSRDYADWSLCFMRLDDADDLILHRFAPDGQFNPNTMTAEAIGLFVGAMARTSDRLSATRAAHA
jgi:hypothetical protein